MPPEPILRVRNLARPPMLRGVSLELDAGRILAVVGPSGAGKSTLARLIARYDQPTGGEVLLEGRAAWPIAEIQLIPQQPAESLNPRFTAAEIVAEPLVIAKGGRTRDYAREVREWMEFVGFPAAASHKPAHEFSGGERQRLAIARALAAGPKLLILDESLSGFPPALQAQIAQLLAGRSCILISHDLSLVAGLAHRMVVLGEGAIVEAGDTAEVIARPQHPLTRQMLAASLALAGGTRV